MIFCSKSTAPSLDHATSVVTGDKPYTGNHSRSSTVIPREAPEDPFNLAGFFPSCSAVSQKEWDWIYWGEDGVENEDDHTSTHHNVSLPSMPGKYKRDQSYDEIARKVIEEEDKYGMLAFSSEKFSSLLPWNMAMFGRTMFPEHVEPSLVDEPVDLDELHLKHCTRRSTVIEQDAEHGLEIRPLFFSNEEEMKKTGIPWAKTILLCLESLVGEL